MSDNLICPECTEIETVDRRRLHARRRRRHGRRAGRHNVGAGAWRRPESRPGGARAAKPAEALCRELFTGLTADQRRQLVLPWNHANRLRTYNAPMNVRISQVYTQAQQDLLQRIMRSISSGEDGYARLSRNGGWDTGGGFGGCGANFFGEVADGRQWAWVFSGHHLTVRCDGDSEPDTAFGGPMYYGHSPDGHSARNVFNFQTRAVQSVYDALNERPTPAHDPVRIDGWRAHRSSGARPTLASPSSELTADQRRLVETVMRELLAPYRREDADEVMALVRRNGGMERLHLGFYRNGNDTPWSYWRVDGPGFVWNFRVLPHVHCYVNIARAPQA